MVNSDDQDDLRIFGLQQPKSIVQFFQESPLVGLELDLERDRDTGRDIEF